MEAGPRDNEEIRGDRAAAVDDLERADATARTEGLDDADGMADGMTGGMGEEPPVEPHELRPQRRLRLWQLAPVVGLGALGSLMFAFPLAFEPGGRSGAVVAMLGLLICGCAAGWGVMAARKVGHKWPGLPAPGSERRAEWRVILLYTVIVGTLAALAIWRVARLR